MQDERPIAEPDMVTCAVCHARIPKRTAARTPAPGYALYFCASCCCEEWTSDRRAVRTPEPTERSL